MARAEPLITPEELECLLGGVTAPPSPPTSSWLQSIQPLHFGALLWLVKGVCLYLVFLGPHNTAVAHAGRYFFMRGALEMLCLSVFWWAALHPKGRVVARGAMLVASTTLIMDMLNLLALP